ncbi:hypothetical protein P775_13145 [Puniceibacterium antarcticum]|uniref:Uncharacterized protein n=1 Tax=Puniceibacterium antarcticum TaxID=1206336 RepID=A0A2G8RDQ1_9RHOB|nr:hypothetical protein [Puniceibacterium antarcticum]PIL19706.1 hypothetical protein P775_13145 [Puniceibacterium antarcticum]
MSRKIGSLPVDELNVKEFQTTYQAPQVARKNRELRRQLREIEDIPSVSDLLFDQLNMRLCDASDSIGQGNSAPLSDEVTATSLSSDDSAGVLSLSSGKAEQALPDRRSAKDLAIKLLLRSISIYSVTSSKAS